MTVNGRPEYVQQACEASLRRLQIPAIDLYYQHRVDPNVPIEETIGAMARLVEQGKVRYLGNVRGGRENDPPRARRASDQPRCRTNIRLWTRDPEEEILAVCRELGIGFVPYSPLGRGMLTGQIKKNEFAENDFRRISPRFQGENFDKNLKLVERVEQTRRGKGLHAGATGAGLGAGAGRRHRADSGHQAPEISG